jgi:4,5-dihydroxyphthalate decarboxylase
VPRPDGRRSRRGGRLGAARRARVPRAVIATREYDFVAPLALGDVVPDGVALTLRRSFDALSEFAADPRIDGGEASFSQYLRRIASGDTSLVGLPVFIMREFRHRCFFVRRDSGMRDVLDLRGRRVGTDAWGASGNTWSRALLTEAGVPLDGIRWFVGPVNADDPPADTRALPSGVAATPGGRALGDLLLDGGLDVLMCPWPPRGFDGAGSRMRRLYEDYRSAEREYYRRTRLYPAHHVVVLRRAWAERHPAAVGAIFQAFVRAREMSEENHRVLHETSPWVLADLEEQRALMGPDFRPYGYRENRAMVAAFCEAQFVQGLIAERLDPDALFADFERLAAARRRRPARAGRSGGMRRRRE